MASHIDLINLSNATHNGTNIPDGWKPLVDRDTLSPAPRHFGPITTQAYERPNGEVVLAIKGTDGQLSDWTQINQAFLSGAYPDAVEELVNYAKGLNDEYGKSDVNRESGVSVTGFSQGGGLSQLLSHTFIACWAIKRCSTKFASLTKSQNAFCSWIE